MAEFRSLFSGSSGNSSFLGNIEEGGLLIDVGMSCKKIRTALLNMGTDIDKIKGILITHEHSDHIKGLETITKNYDIPVYGSKGTIELLVSNGIIRKEELAFAVSGTFFIDDMEIEPFNISHDVVEPFGYRIKYGDNTFGIATDLGLVTNEVREGLKGSDMVLIESNYDLKMLKTGSYSDFLKKRIAGKKGHLSNNECADFACELIEGGATRIVLGHLSNNNNLPDIAKNTTLKKLAEKGMVEGKDFLLQVAKRDRISDGVYM